ncbi:hypothetical protein MVEN_01085800 [Mycena venus]|uniref:Uncharacterized protein n=1 Tax=Mycena venus TaxID=2733690 RepID=A0A8H6Y8U4_9AGAR|nr:hypothetical protein MVEN_01085800 [Mycena venus]
MAMAFCSALIANPTRAVAVRSFTVDKDREWYSSSSAGLRFSHLLIASIKLMVMLEHLSIYPYVWSSQSEIGLLLWQQTFPRLLTCDIGLPYGAPGDTFTHFCSRHPALTRLRLRSMNKVKSPPSNRVSLSNLVYYDGQAELLPFVIAGGLKAAQIMWHADADIEHIIVALSSLTRPDIPFYSYHEYCDDYCIPIITFVSMHMPQTKTLQMCSLVDFDRLLNRETIDHLLACLPAFLLVSCT